MRFDRFFAKIDFKNETCKEMGCFLSLWFSNGIDNHSYLQGSEHSLLGIIARTGKFLHEGGVDDDPLLEPFPCGERCDVGGVELR